MLTGRDLFAIIKESQIAAFTDFYTVFFEKLILASDKYVKDIFIAEEIVQNVFIKVWESPETLEEINSVEAYLYRSVVNASLNYVNRQRNIEHHHQKIVDSFTQEDLTELEDNNNLIVLLHCEINKLPPQCQKVFKMNRFESLKYKEIALLLNISERTVENHISTALKTLRKSFLSKKP